MTLDTNYAVLRRVLEYARSLGLSEGDKLPSYRHLADALNVERHRIHDALVQAEAMGLVRVFPRAGAFIQSAPPAPLIEFFKFAPTSADSDAQQFA